jgi:hypothetical protein
MLRLGVHETAIGEYLEGLHISPERHTVENLLHLFTIIDTRVSSDQIGLDDVGYHVPVSISRVAAPIHGSGLV